MLTTVILILVGIILTLRFISFRKHKMIINKIPGPTDGYPVIGHLLSFFISSEEIWCYFRKLATEYYPIYKYWHLHIGVINILSPEDMEIVLSTTKHITKSVIYDCLHPWLGTGLLTSTGKKWQYRRKILTPAFHFNVLQQFLPIFLEESKALVQQLQHECEEEYTDVTPFITECTLNTVCETAMGTRLRVDDETSTEYVKSISRMGEILSERIRRPWYSMQATFMLTSLYQEQKKLLGILHNFSNSVIKERMANVKNYNNDKPINKKQKRLAMLDLLISVKNSGEPIDNDGIREEVDTFMFEGHDTTTACISFTLLAIANNSDIQNKLVKELEQVFGNSNRDATYEDLQKLHYLEKVLKESLRMYPSVPFISRVSSEDIKTHSGYVIPANTILQLHIYDLHHNPDIYPEPEKFDPERFSLENMNKRHPFAYIPFSAGPRNCIGQKFAFLEIKTVISSILRNFTLESVDKPSDVTMLCNLVLRSNSGIKIKFKKRNK